MAVFTRIRSVFRSLFRKRELDHDLDEELRSYVELLTEEKIRAGADPLVAAQQARLELGGLEQVKERVRERRLGAALDTLGQDVRLAFRMLGRNAGFTVVALLILAIGIGANTALFGTVDTVLLHGLPFHRPDRLVIGLKAFNGDLSGPVSRVDYYDYRDHDNAFEQLAALTTFTEQETVTGRGDPDLVDVVYVTWNLFPALGVNPAVGRGFLPEEEARGRAASIVISYGYWERSFGGSPDMVGSTLVVDGAPLTIVGVMPRGFRFMYAADAWRLIDRSGPFDTQRDSHSHWVVGRLKPGVTMARAQGELDAISAGLAEQYPDSNAGKTLVLEHLQDYMVRNVRVSLLLLLGTTGLVLLIACGNVGGLLLVRGEGRRVELALRSALGASRPRLLRQLLVESILLTLGGGLLGIGVAWLMHGLLIRLLPIGELGIQPPGMNATALGFTLLLSIATGLVVGVVPAVRGSASGPAGQLRTGSHATTGVPSTRLRSSVVIFQVALSALLLVGSGLLIRSLARLSTVNLGFETRNLLTGQLQIEAARYPTAAARNQFFTTLLEEIETLPGVESAALANKLPIRSRWQDWSVWPVGRPPASRSEEFSAMARWVTPGYFRTLRIPLVTGRDISPTDVPGSPAVIVLSEGTARALFPGADPIGQRIRVGDFADFEIVGVVRDARINTLRGAPDAAMYMAATQLAPGQLQIAVRSTRDPALLVRPIERIIHAKDPNVLFARPRTMRAVVDDELASFRIVILSLVLFAGVALVLAATGLYGVLAWHVSQRKGEFGIRRAVGASNGHLVRMVLRHGLALTAAGLVAGLAVAWPATLVLRQLLYETAPLEPAAYLGAAGVFALVATLACYVPARRASRTHVMDVLRLE